MITPQLDELVLTKDCSSWEELNAVLMSHPSTLTFVATADIMLISTLFGHGGTAKAGTKLNICHY